MLLHSFFYNSKLIYGENSCQTIKYRMFFDSLTKCFKPVTKNFCIHLAIFGNTMVDIGKCITSSPCVLHVFSNTSRANSKGCVFPSSCKQKSVALVVFWVNYLFISISTSALLRSTGNPLLMQFQI